MEDRKLLAIVMRIDLQCRAIHIELARKFYVRTVDPTLMAMHLLATQKPRVDRYRPKDIKFYWS